MKGGTMSPQALWNFQMQTVICMENRVLPTTPHPLGFLMPLCERGMDIFRIHTMLCYMLKLKNKPMKMK